MGCPAAPHFPRAGPQSIEVDFLCSGAWETYETLLANGYKYHVFPEGFSAHWVRLTPVRECVLTAEFIYT